LPDFRRSISQPKLVSRDSDEQRHAPGRNSAGQVWHIDNQGIALDDPDYIADTPDLLESVSWGPFQRDLLEPSDHEAK